jgi:hypothetical protein
VGNAERGDRSGSPLYEQPTGPRAEGLRAAFLATSEVTVLIRRRLLLCVGMRVVPGCLGSGPTPLFPFFLCFASEFSVFLSRWIPPSASDFVLSCILFSFISPICSIFYGRAFAGSRHAVMAGWSATRAGSVYSSTIIHMVDRRSACHLMWTSICFVVFDFWRWPVAPALSAVGHLPLAEQNVSDLSRPLAIQIQASTLICSFSLFLLLAGDVGVGFSCLDPFFCVYSAC